jgi:hypothetical protein
VASSTNYEALHYTLFTVLLLHPPCGVHIWTSSRRYSFLNARLLYFSIVLTSVPVGTTYKLKWLRPFRLVRRRNHIHSDFFCYDKRTKKSVVNGRLSLRVNTRLRLYVSVIFSQYHLVISADCIAWKHFCTLDRSLKVHHLYIYKQVARAENF